MKYIALSMIIFMLSIKIFSEKMIVDILNKKMDSAWYTVKM